MLIALPHSYEHGVSPKLPIENVTILNPEMRNGPRHDNKLSRLDLLVRLLNGQLINS